MNFVALRMLTGDRAKYFGLVFAIAFCTFLLENQTSIFASIMRRTASQILDVTDAEVWVMDPKTEYWDQTKALKDTDLTRVRGVTGVAWAVRLFKGSPVAKTLQGRFAVSVLLGLDDATLSGAPRKMLLGSWERLREPDSMIIDQAGYVLLFPGEPLELGRILEMNDHRVTIVGISDASAPFLSVPIMPTRYSEAVNFVGRERTQLSFIIARPLPGTSPAELAERIAARTSLRARTTQQFMWDGIGYYLRNTGIPVNFGITILVALIVGTVVAGQTFYLFTVENLKQFGALKAMGVTNPRLVGMILLQAVSGAALGFGLGTGMAATFFEIFRHKLATPGIVLLWQCEGLTGACILFVVAMASIPSIPRGLGFPAPEDVAVPLLIAGISRKEALDRAGSLLSRLGLSHRIHALPSKLSGGQQQRVALARALIHEPRLVICDEPTAALDHASGEAVMSLLAGNAVHPDRAVIVVTHDTRVFHYAQSIAHMDDGRIAKVTRKEA